MNSIEWLRQELHSFIMGNSKLGYDEIIERAKKMHKQEIITTYIVADSESTQEDAEHNAEKYYEREFKKD